MPPETTTPAGPFDETEDIYSYHRPDEEDVRKISNIREAAKALDRAILANTPKCADQSAARRKCREAMMTANAAIVLKGKC
jgi:hypothetical protein